MINVAVGRLCLALCISLLVVCSAWAKHEKRKFALIVGNANYPASIGSIPNAKRELDDIAQDLLKYHFDVTYVLNASRDSFRQKLSTFSSQIQNADVALFYYTGHGDLDVAEGAYFPIDVMIFPDKKAYVSEVERSLGGAKLGIIVIDACRGPGDGGKGSPSRQGQLPRSSPVRPSSPDSIATIVKIFSTGRGETASPGEKDKLGPFAQAFLNNIKKPNASLYYITGQIAHQVRANTGGIQNPFWEPPGSLTNEPYFNEKENSEDRQ